MRNLWPKSKAWYFAQTQPWYFCSKMTKFEIDLKLIEFDCRLKSDENEAFLAKQ